jgi:hypothetical protein
MEAGTLFGKNSGKQQAVHGKKSAAYCSKQGNCIDSLHPNRLCKPIALWGIPLKVKEGLIL